MLQQRSSFFPQSCRSGLVLSAGFPGGFFCTTGSHCLCNEKLQRTYTDWLISSRKLFLRCSNSPLALSSLKEVRSERIKTLLYKSENGSCLSSRSLIRSRVSEKLIWCRFLWNLCVTLWATASAPVWSIPFSLLSSSPSLPQWEGKQLLVEVGDQQDWAGTEQVWWFLFHVCEWIVPYRSDFECFHAY